MSAVNVSPSGLVDFLLSDHLRRDRVTDLKAVIGNICLNSGKKLEMIVDKYHSLAPVARCDAIRSLFQVEEAQLAKEAAQNPTVRGLLTRLKVYLDEEENYIKKGWNLAVFISKIEKIIETPHKPGDPAFDRVATVLTVTPAASAMPAKFASAALAPAAPAAAVMSVALAASVGVRRADLTFVQQLTMLVEESNKTLSTWQTIQDLIEKEYVRPFSEIGSKEAVTDLIDRLVSLIARGPEGQLKEWDLSALSLTLQRISFTAKLQQKIFATILGRGDYSYWKGLIDFVNSIAHQWVVEAAKNRKCWVHFHNLIAVIDAEDPEVVERLKFWKLNLEDFKVQIHNLRAAATRQLQLDQFDPPKNTSEWNQRLELKFIRDMIADDKIKGLQVLANWINKGIDLIWLNLTERELRDVAPLITHIHVGRIAKDADQEGRASFLEPILHIFTNITSAHIHIDLPCYKRMPFFPKLRELDISNSAIVEFPEGMPLVKLHCRDNVTDYLHLPKDLSTVRELNLKGSLVAGLPNRLDQVEEIDISGGGCYTFPPETSYPRLKKLNIRGTTIIGKLPSGSYEIID